MPGYDPNELPPVLKDLKYDPNELSDALRDLNQTKKSLQPAPKISPRKRKPQDPEFEVRQHKAQIDARISVLRRHILEAQREANNLAGTVDSLLKEIDELIHYADVKVTSDKIYSD